MAGVDTRLVVGSTSGEVFRCTCRGGFAIFVVQDLYRIYVFASGVHSRCYRISVGRRLVRYFSCLVALC